MTLITHGFESDSSFPSWVASMADDIPAYYRFPGTNFTTYRITLTYSNAYYYTWSRVNGGPPAATDSGEIIVELDWSALSGNLFNSYASTLNVAGAVNQLFQMTNLTTELGGHALAEFPIHLIGHSRGGSLVAELSRQLGTNGIWVDQVTTLDPYPINNDGDSDFPASVVDATAKYTYANVLFADNYWQDLGAGVYLGDPDGEAVSGAYVRQLFNLSGGYANVSSSSADHSNVHLWYHGTVELATPASDGSASVTGAERTNWWYADENSGVAGGFDYSLIGGGNRQSTVAPPGAGPSAVRNGYNQMWDLGAGMSNNRTALAANNGTWPNLIKFDRLDTNPVVQGQSASVKYYYQWAAATTNQATISFYLDSDLNALNTNQTLLKQINVPTNGASSVSFQTVSLTFNTSNAPPGWHNLFARISDGVHSRYVYAPERVQVLSLYQPPALDIVRLNASQVQIGVNGLAGQTVILQSGGDLYSFQPIATNSLSTNRWVVTDSSFSASGSRFYRAVLGN